MKTVRLVRAYRFDDGTQVVILYINAEALFQHELVIADCDDTGCAASERAPTAELRVAGYRFVDKPAFHEGRDARS